MTFIYRGGSNDLVNDFLFRGAALHQDDTLVRTEMVMDSRMEGWVGIPHGGIGMGAVMELATRLRTTRQGGESMYPLSVSYRMGGASLRTGDRVTVKVSREEGGVQGTVSTDKNTFPYISAMILYGTDVPSQKAHFQTYLPERYESIRNKLLLLPHGKRCFVCGAERTEPGLVRRFYFLNSDHPRKVIVSRAGFDIRDADTFFMFQRNGTMHPVALLSLIDEVMGWAGFMMSACAGVTVRIGFTLYRDIYPGEQIVIFGRGEKMKGNANSRLLCGASGGAAVVNKDGGLEIVIAASGQWLSVQKLNEQMKQELIPPELTARAFRIAGIQYP